jgi:hypothetical protein
MPAHDRDHPTLAVGRFFRGEATAASRCRDRAGRPESFRVDVGDQPLELGPGPDGVDRSQPVVELLHAQPPLRSGDAQHLGRLLALGVGGAQLGECVAGRARVVHGLILRVCSEITSLFLLPGRHELRAELSEKPPTCS